MPAEVTLETLLHIQLRRSSAQPFLQTLVVGGSGPHHLAEAASLSVLCRPLSTSLAGVSKSSSRLVTASV